MLNVVVVDNENLVRRGTAELLRQIHEVRVVAEYESSKPLMTHLRQEHVSLVVMEWRLNALDGLETIARLIKIYPKTKVMILSSHLQGAFPAHIWSLGIAGMVSRNDRFDEFVSGVKAVLRGERFLSAEVSKAMVNRMFTNNADSPFEGLSHREKQVLMMVIEGVTVQEIAERLCLSKKTVNTYRYRLFEKLGVKNEVDLTRLALRHGLLEDAKVFQPLGMSVASSPSEVNFLH